MQELRLAMGELQHTLEQGIQEMNTPGQFIYIGSYNHLASRIDALSDEDVDMIKTVAILLRGRKVKEGSPCCVCATCIFGCILCIPCCFMACQWWKKIALEAFEIPIQVYQNIARLFRSTKLVDFRLIVQDNTLEKAKIDILYNSILNSTTQTFKFQNVADQFSFGYQECYDNFEENFAPLRAIGRIESNITWSKRQ